MLENKMMAIIDENLEVGEEQEAFKIDTDILAEWGIEKISELEKEYKRYEDVVKEKVLIMEMNLKKEKEQMERDRSFFESKLREYFHTVKVKETKTQLSYKLPSGVLKMRKLKMDFDNDNDKLLEYAKENELKELIKTTERFTWGEFKKKLSIEGNSIVNKETGEVLEIEGLGIKEKPEEFKVEVD